MLNPQIAIREAPCSGLVCRAHNWPADTKEIQKSCGPANGLISMAGSATVEPVARILSEIHKLGCPMVVTSIEGGGSSHGAGAVCGNPEMGPSVDIGNMSRKWKSKEGKDRDGFGFVCDCVKGGEALSAIKVDVDLDGITVVLQKGGIGDRCRRTLGGGFTVDQLRWIFSSHGEDELEAQGWDRASLLNSDLHLTTHLWSELDSRCDPQEIRLASDILNEGPHTNFKDATLTANDEGGDIDLDQPLGHCQALGFELVAYTQHHIDAIAYIGYNCYFDNAETLAAAAIENDQGVFVSPSAKTIGKGSYNPLVCSISMNLLNEQASPQNTVPLLWFGYSHPQLVTATGMVPVQGDSLAEMHQRLNLALKGELLEADDEEVDDEMRLSVGAIVGICIGNIFVLAFVCTAVHCFCTQVEAEKSTLLGRMTGLLQ